VVGDDEGQENPSMQKLVVSQTRVACNEAETYSANERGTLLLYPTSSGGRGSRNKEREKREAFGEPAVRQSLTTVAQCALRSRVGNCFRRMIKARDC